MATSHSDWSRAVNLKQYIVKLYLHDKTNTPEFQIMERIYGREKLDAMWAEHQRTPAQPIHYTEKEKGEDDWQFISGNEYTSKMLTGDVLQACNPYPDGSRYVRLKKKQFDAA